MVSSAESHKVGVISRRRNGDGTSTADVSVAQLVSQTLQFVSVEVIVVPQNVVVAGTASALYRMKYNITKLIHPSIHFEDCIFT